MRFFEAAIRGWGCMILLLLATDAFRWLWHAIGARNMRPEFFVFVPALLFFFLIFWMHGRMCND